MINTNDFKTGQTIKFNNQIYQIIEFLHVKPGKGTAFVRSKLRNLRTGSVIDHTFNAGIKLEPALINKIKMQFLYSSQEKYIFMNTQTYEQLEINKDQLKEKLHYLYEGLLVEIIFYNNNEILTISLPDKISLKVTYAEPGVKGDTKTNSFKDATLETGLVIKVPLFINTGEKIIVNTETGLYLSRDNNK
ncbi:Elongation factor P (EF-P) [Candidatus Phytoplasma australiense]|uniref:Elongation factor P n=2 Tax=Phytoplasma australiense TaxID=59748 RepID=EFP_PHYAS|nr:elongation factor P [Candidatus Phytoplasma australiense]B1VAJ8.1 RecName: Full=Elongation factor P; Short=EF-P [Candidatus Phytoplasma australiense]AGL90369.1 Elongation factor P [Strawberry lethal yellows phytoplasma (CPA) str. NZSb11]CAM11971.1 Elongation factor P (EF-P) [Candidatus Phytoplasma australiense]